MKRDLDYLNENWSTMPEFKAYREAIEKVPDLGEKRYADRYFSIMLPRVSLKSVAICTSNMCQRL